MITRPPMLGSVTLALAPAMTTGIGSLTGEQVAWAQTAAPIPDPADNTPVGAPEQTDLGAPVDETNQPPTNNPAPAAPGTPAPGTPGATTPLAGTPAPGTGSPSGPYPPFSLTIVMPNAPGAGNGSVAPAPKTSTTKKKSTKKTAKKKRKHAKKRRRASQKTRSRR